MNTRFTRIFPIMRSRLQANLDVHNLFNANTVLALNTRYGPSWQQPTSILSARVLKIGFQLDF